MSDSLAPSAQLAASASHLTPWQRAALNTVIQLAQQLVHGHLTLIDQGERYEFGNADDTLRATVVVRHPSFYTRMLRGGAVGAGEAYMEGVWDTPDLYSVIRVLARNAAVFEHMEFSWGRTANVARRVLHFLRRNSVSGARQNIHAHYDLGNDFFRLWLDSRMMYSSAIYPRPDASLEEAAEHKLWTVCHKLQLKPEDHLLEIGTGWGGMAIHAAKHFGCRVTTTTISEEQYALAAERVRQAGLEDRISVVLQDYRTLEGQYDKLVSIEMIEAVGDDYLDTYFEKCSRLLKADGVMVLQAITTPDHAYHINKDSIDFVKRYIFPGGQVPSMARMMECVRKVTDLRLEHCEDFGRHYARTLLHWREGFHRQLEEVRRQGYPERFIRMWDYYLNYCAGGFAERRIGVAHLVLSKPGCALAWGAGQGACIDFAPANVE